eukprot:jgi/Mesvir1/302/Mv13626-RA.1
MAAGLGLTQVLASMVRLHAEANPNGLVLLINTTGPQRATLRHELHVQGASSCMPEEVNAEFTSAERQALYSNGGCIMVTSRILVVDLLSDRVRRNAIKGIIVVNAHRVTDSSAEAFIVRLYREGNADGFCRALSDSPPSFQGGFSKVERTMRCLFVRKLYLWPRFHVGVHDVLDAAPPDVIELRSSLTPLMQAIHGALTDVMGLCLRELKRCPAVDLSDVKLEDGMFKALGASLHAQLDPVWHTLGPKTKQVVSDLRTLRELASALLRYDAATFLGTLDMLRVSEGPGSVWMHLPAAAEVFEAARRRVYQMGRVDPRTRRVTPLQTTSLLLAQAGAPGKKRKAPGQGPAPRGMGTESGSEPGTPRGGDKGKDDSCHDEDDQDNGGGGIDQGARSTSGGNHRGHNEGPGGGGNAAGSKVTGSGGQGGGSSQGDRDIVLVPVLEEPPKWRAVVDVLREVRFQQDMAAAMLASVTSTLPSGGRHWPWMRQGPCVGPFPCTASRRLIATPGSGGGGSNVKAKAAARWRCISLGCVLVVTKEEHSRRLLERAVAQGGEAVMEGVLWDYLEGRPQLAKHYRGGNARRGAAPLRGKNLISHQGAQRAGSLHGKAVHEPEGVQMSGEKLGGAPGRGIARPGAHSGKPPGKGKSPVGKRGVGKQKGGGPESSSSLAGLEDWEDEDVAAGGGGVVDPGTGPGTAGGPEEDGSMVLRVRTRDGTGGAELASGSSWEREWGGVDACGGGADEGGGDAVHIADQDHPRERVAGNGNGKIMGMAKEMVMDKQGGSGKTFGVGKESDLGNEMDSSDEIGTGTEFTPPLRPDEVPHNLRIVSLEGGGVQLAAERPSFIIMFDPDLAFTREVEVYSARLRAWEREGVEAELAGMAGAGMRVAAFSEEATAPSTGISLNPLAPLPPTTRKAGGGRRGAGTHAASRPVIVVDMREFMSSLPAILNQQRIQVVPVTLEVGDYVLTPDICVERKSLSDLYSSFKSGRLYTQAEAMCKHYRTPVLLIEFSGDRSFALQSAADLTEDINSQALSSKLALLALHFPRLRLVWSRSQHATAEIFLSLKENSPEPDPKVAAAVGIPLESDVCEDPRDALHNEAAQDALRRLPGVTDHNFRLIMAKCGSLAQLAQMSEAQLQELLGGEKAGRALHSFLTARCPVV